MNDDNIANYSRCKTCRRIYDYGAKHDCNNTDQPIVIGNGCTVSLSQDYATPADKMKCFVCLVELRKEHTCQPIDALCFSGDGHYGSNFDREAMTLDFSKFEIFICDKCFDARKSLVVGWPSSEEW